MKKKLFTILACVALAAVLTVSICAAKQTVDVTNALYGSFGTGYLNSFTGSSYADTVADASGNEVISVYIYINNAIVAQEQNYGSTYTTAWATYPGSAGAVEGRHYISRNGYLYDGHTVVFP